MNSPTYEEVLKLIDESPNEGAWSALRLHVSALRKIMDVKTDRLGQCWTRRQRNNIIALYMGLKIRQEL